MEDRTPLARVVDHQGRRQTWLARTAGMSRPHVNRLVNGRRPMTPRAAQRLGAVLGVAPELLLPSQESGNGHAA